MKYKEFNEHIHQQQQKLKKDTNRRNLNEIRKSHIRPKQLKKESTTEGEIKHFLWTSTDEYFTNLTEQNKTYLNTTCSQIEKTTITELSQELISKIKQNKQKKSIQKPEKAESEKTHNETIHNNTHADIHMKHMPSSLANSHCNSNSNFPSTMTPVTGKNRHTSGDDILKLPTKRGLQVLFDISKISNMRDMQYALAYYDLQTLNLPSRSLNHNTNIHSHSIKRNKNKKYRNLKNKFQKNPVNHHQIEGKSSFLHVNPSNKLEIWENGKPKLQIEKLNQNTQKNTQSSSSFPASLSPISDTIPANLEKNNSNLLNVDEFLINENDLVLTKENLKLRELKFVEKEQMRNIFKKTDIVKFIDNLYSESRKRHKQREDQSVHCGKSSEPNYYEIEDEVCFDILFHNHYLNNVILKDRERILPELKRKIEKEERRGAKREFKLANSQELEKKYHHVMGVGINRNLIKKGLSDEYAYEESSSEEFSTEAYCSICFSGDYGRSNMILYCDGCNIGVHQSCYGVVLIPEGSFLCDKCTYLNKKYNIMKVNSEETSSSVSTIPTYPEEKNCKNQSEEKESNILSNLRKERESDDKCVIFKTKNNVRIKGNLSDIKKGETEKENKIFEKECIECELCGGRKGAMKRHRKDWFHVTCIFMNEGTYFNDMHLVDSISISHDIDMHKMSKNKKEEEKVMTPERIQLNKLIHSQDTTNQTTSICSICKKQGGILKSCACSHQSLATKKVNDRENENGSQNDSDKECDVKAHILCAYLEGFEIEVKNSSEKNSKAEIKGLGICVNFYCLNHTNKVRDQGFIRERRYLRYHGQPYIQ
jgi:hypothetical protein